MQNTLNLLLLVLELLDLSQLFGVQPLNDLVTLLSNAFLVIIGDLVLQLLIVDGRLHVEAVGLEVILDADAIMLLLILGLELLGIADHALDFLLGQPALVVGDGDLVLLAGGLVHDRHVEDTIGINVEGDFDLGNSTWCRSDSSQVELSKQVIVLGHSPLTLVNLDGDGRLVV